MKDIPYYTNQIGNQTEMRLPLAIKEQVEFNPEVEVEFEINETRMSSTHWRDIRIPKNNSPDKTIGKRTAAYALPMNT